MKKITAFSFVILLTLATSFSSWALDKKTVPGEGIYLKRSG